MAKRRMFTLDIIDTDAFLDMPLTSQALYFHLSMRADDDGFVSNPQKIMRMIGSMKNDMDVLTAKRFVLPFEESGILVIKHWKMHNYIQKDRYTSTVYLEEKEQLEVKENKSYTRNDVCIQDGYTSDTQVSIGKVSLDKLSIVKDSIEKKDKKIYKELSFISNDISKVKLTEEEYNKLIERYDVKDVHKKVIDLDLYISSTGKKYKSHYSTILAWARRDNLIEINKPKSKERIVF